MGGASSSQQTKEPVHALPPLDISQIKPPLWLGTWAWDNESVFGAAGKNLQGQKEAFRAALEHGCRCFDSAEVYNSERVLQRFTKELKEDEKVDDALRNTEIIVASKFFPSPWRLWKSSLRTALEASLKRLGRPYVDLYMVHSSALTLRSVSTALLP